MNSSQADAARFLNINRKTVASKLSFLSKFYKETLVAQRHKFLSLTAFQFDELITFEHTKCKPLSIAIAVSKPDQKILGFRVSTMPATGRFEKASKIKYGFRQDLRKQSLGELLKELSLFLPKKIKISCDQCYFYEPLVKKYVPQSNLSQHKSRRPKDYGQGDLKQGKNDPIFHINQSLAMLRSHIRRLIRETWVTTKKTRALIDHLTIYAWAYNNAILLKKTNKK